MPLDWIVQQSRLSFFSSEPLSISEQDWKTITGQDEAENRTALPNGKQYSGKFSGGLFSLAYSGVRCDVLLNVDESAQDPAQEQELRGIGKWDEVSDSFPRALEPFLSGLKSPLVRLAFGAILMWEARSKEDAYEEIGKLLSSVEVDPKNMRDLIYRINWPRMSAVIPDLELNRITSWGSMNISKALLQMTGQQMSIAAAGPALHTVRLEIDHSTSQNRTDPFEPSMRMPIFSELVEMARANARDGERP
jgi:hypothetical protein